MLVYQDQSQLLQSGEPLANITLNIMLRLEQNSHLFTRSCMAYILIVEKCLLHSVTLKQEPLVNGYYNA